MSLNLKLYRLIPLSGVGRIGPQPKVFALGTNETLAAAQAAGYIDDLVNLKVPYANRELVPGDLIMLRYNIGGSAPNLPAWSLQQVTWAADTYTLADAFSGSSGDAVTSVFARTGAVVAASGDYTAADITVTPAGGITAVEAQAALAELDTKKAALAGAVFTGAVTLAERKYATGAAATVGKGALVAGVLTVNTSAVAADSVIKVTRMGLNASPVLGFLTVGTITAGTSFVINSLSSAAAAETTDVSEVAWEIVNPAS